MSATPDPDYTANNAPEQDNRRNLLLLGAIAIVTILAALAFYILFLRPTGGSETVDPTPTPETSQPIPPEQLWDDIRARGRLVIGTSADYPPFASYDRNFQLTGFDIALARDIASRLGLEVEFRDIAFDGLNNALQMGQIDLAMAAISRTAERESIADFSAIYYVSQDATLFRADDPLDSISSVVDLTSRRVGVQSSSVYSNWFQRELVATGQMPAANLFTYERIDTALLDLRQGRIDAVIMDLPPAERAVVEGGLKIVNTGFRPQNLAIAMRPGTTAVQNNINLALGQAQASGRVQQLITEYLRIPPEEIVPLPTELPQTATPVATATPLPCVDSMSFVQDLNLNDYNMTAPPILAPGQAFSKGWRIRNTGTCTWDSRYTFQFAGGSSPQAQMNGQPTAVQAKVPPGATYDMYVSMVAPLIPGTYQGFWTMRNPNSQPFGDRVWVGIRVPAPATATPLPTQTPATDIFFAVDRFQITQGQCVTFNWRVQNAQQTHFFRNGEAWQNFPVPPESQRVECPATTTTYNLRVVRSNGATEIQQATIYVNPQINAPNIAQFVTNPPQITLGQCTTLQWTIQGAVNQAVLTANGQSIWDNAPAAGSFQNCPTAAGTVEYALQATGPGGSSRAVAYATVYEPATATPVPTLPPEVPIINQFAASPTQITAGQCVQINWVTSGGTSQVRTLRNGQPLQTNAPLAGSFQDCPTGTGIVTYRLEASNVAGQIVSQERTVSIAEDPTINNPLANTLWDVVSLQETNTLEAAMPTLAFDENGNVSGTTGCNQFNGNYVLSGVNLRFSAVSSSNLFCSDPEGVMEQEALFIRTLNDVTRLELAPDGRSLVMYDFDGDELLRAELNLLR